MRNINLTTYFRKSILLALLGTILVMGGVFVLYQQALAQQESSPEIISQEIDESKVIQAVTADEQVTPQDLGVKDPKLLPDSRFYFLKNWARKIRLYLTFNPVKKLDLESRYANERLIELKKLVLKKKNPEIIKKALRNYEDQIERIKSISEKLKEKASQNPEIGKFLDKFTRHQILHQRILKKLENQVPPEVFQRIKEARERHLRRFGEVMTRLENKEKIPERLEKNLEKLKGSKFKNLRNLEVLKELEEKAPDQSKEAIRKAREKILEKTKRNIENWSSQDLERFKAYVEKISGNREEQLEILESLRSELKENPELREKLQEVRKRIIKQIPKKVIKAGCPEIKLPAPDFCKEGRIVFERDQKGCIISLKCIIPAELQARIPPKEKKKVCIAVWDPVCGKDGRTYSNECFAKIAGVEISYKGVCKKEMTCAEKCRSMGYSAGICRSWSTSALLKKGCRENEENIGETLDCRVVEKTSDIEKACCCVKIKKVPRAQPLQEETESKTAPFFPAK